MHPFLTRPLDWLAIQLARLSVPSGATPPFSEDEARALAQDPGFLDDPVQPATLRFETPGQFSFPSPVQTRWEENNRVRGYFVPASVHWTRRPTTLLLHGWNGDLAHRVFFPRLARRLVRRGVNAVMIELPYHGRRKPRREGQRFNFISGDLPRMMQAIRQGVADISALAAWFRAQSTAPVGLWGYSMGGWLAGLSICGQSHFDFAVLLCAVARMERVARELAFCRPVQESLERCPLDLNRINLRAGRLRIPPERVLLVAADHDLFVPVETLEEVWENWGRPQLWRLPHGHLSIMASSSALNRVSDWIAATAREAGARNPAM